MRLRLKNELPTFQVRDTYEIPSAQRSSRRRSNFRCAAIP